MGKIKDAWEEARLLTDGMYSVWETIKVFLRTIAVEVIVGPFLFWWLEDRKRKSNKELGRVNENKFHNPD